LDKVSVLLMVAGVAIMLLGGLVAAYVEAGILPLVFNVLGLVLVVAAVVRAVAELQAPGQTSDSSNKSRERTWSRWKTCPSGK